MPNMLVTSARRYRIGRVCEMLNVSRWQIKAWAEKGWIPHGVSEGGHLRFSIDDIEQIKKVIEFDAKSE